MSATESPFRLPLVPQAAKFFNELLSQHYPNIQLKEDTFDATLPETDDIIALNMSFEKYFPNLKILSDIFITIMQHPGAPSTSNLRSLLQDAAFHKAITSDRSELRFKKDYDMSDVTNYIIKGYSSIALLTEITEESKEEINKILEGTYLTDQAKGSDLFCLYYKKLYIIEKKLYDEKPGTSSGGGPKGCADTSLDHDISMPDDDDLIVDKRNPKDLEIVTNYEIRSYIFERHKINILDYPVGTCGKPIPKMECEKHSNFNLIGSTSSNCYTSCNVNRISPWIKHGDHYFLTCMCCGLPMLPPKANKTDRWTTAPISSNPQYDKYKDREKIITTPKGAKELYEYAGKTQCDHICPLTMMFFGLNKTATSSANTGLLDKIGIGSNFVPIHPTCNVKKSNLTPEQFWHMNDDVSDDDYKWNEKWANFPNGPWNINKKSINTWCENNKWSPKKYARMLQIKYFSPLNYLVHVPNETSNTKEDIENKLNELFQIANVAYKSINMVKDNYANSLINFRRLMGSKDKFNIQDIRDAFIFLSKEDVQAIHILQLLKNPPTPENDRRLLDIIGKLESEIEVTSLQKFISEYERKRLEEELRKAKRTTALKAWLSRSREKIIDRKQKRIDDLKKKLKRQKLELREYETEQASRLGLQGYVDSSSDDDVSGGNKRRKSKKHKKSKISKKHKKSKKSKKHKKFKKSNKTKKHKKSNKTKKYKKSNKTKKYKN